jgi:hypothetical protein
MTLPPVLTPDSVEASEASFVDQIAMSFGLALGIEDPSDPAACRQ